MSERGDKNSKRALWFGGLSLALHAVLFVLPVSETSPKRKPAQSIVIELVAPSLQPEQASAAQKPERMDPAPTPPKVKPSTQPVRAQPAPKKTLDSSALKSVSIVEAVDKKNVEVDEEIADPLATAPANIEPGDAVAQPPDTSVADAIAKAMAVGPSATRERRLLLPKGGSGPITGEALVERVQGLATLDAQLITARHRNEMGLNHPHTSNLSAALHTQWDPSISDVKGFGLRPALRDHQGLPEHMLKMLQMEADGAVGGPMGPISPGQGTIGQATAAMGQAASRCTFEYYALGWYSLLIEPGGNVLDLAVFRSSGSASVDTSIMESVRRAGPFTEIPSEAMGEDGLFRGTWEYGFRDYSNSNCKTKRQNGEPYHAAIIAYRGAFY